MKKFILLSSCIILSHFLHAQSYQCLQAGVKHYFTNSNGYLRGIRIDSVKTTGDSTIFFPFHTPRGSYVANDLDVYSTLDSNAGSWLGKKVVQKTDGTFIFDSYWNDSVVIKTQAHLGDNWVLYTDTGTLYYKATVIGENTMTVLSMLDSVKTILITAQNSLGIVTTDPLDSFTIILSKNHGFVEVPDLYTFPYHKPDSAYRFGLDFYLDRSTCTYGEESRPASYAPDKNISLFKLIDFINPNEQQLHNWNIGDIIESSNQLGTILPGSFFSLIYLQDTIVNKITAADLVTYIVNGSSTDCHYPYGFPPCSLICKAGAYNFSDRVFPLLDTVHMPEEKDHYNRNSYLFYFPGDTTFCSNSPLYVQVPKPFFISDMSYPSIAKFKLGIGKTYFNYGDGDLTRESDQLIAYDFGSSICGSFIPTEVKNIKVQPGELLLFPNPAKDLITLTATYIIASAAIINTLGQVITIQNGNAAQMQIDVSHLVTGVYFVKVNGNEVKRIVKD